MNNYFNKNNLKSIFLLAAFLIIFGMGFFVGKTQVICKVCAPEKIDFSLFWQAWDKVHQEYVTPEKLDDQKMVYGAISGMINSIGDPYTLFFEPTEAQQFLDEVTGQFEGIGAELGIKDGQLQVISPLEGSPAQKAGLRAGDKIIKIGDKLTSDLTIDQAVKMIKGPKGTEISLSILRGENNKTIDLKIKRDIINIPSLKWEIKGDKKDIAYIKIFQFSEKAGSDFRQAAYKISMSETKKILLDLRDNPGGYLEVSKDIAGWLLNRGKIVTIEDFNNKRDPIIYKAEGNSRFANYPMVILLNKGSASASEILAAALRENRGIKIVGETSYGKGSVQQLENLYGGSSLKITVANWLTPLKNHITNTGLKPDVEIKITDDQYKNEQDPQIDKALEILNSLN